MIVRAALCRDLGRLKDGQRDAARPVFDALWPALVTFAARALDDETLAEDAAQRAIVTLFREVHRYDENRDALSWAFALAMWEVRSLQRDRRRAHARAGGDAAEVLDTLAHPGEDPERLAAQRELRALLDHALAALPILDRAELLAFLDDAVLEHAARPPLSARLRQRRRRALGRLRSMWRELYGDI